MHKIGLPSLLNGQRHFVLMMIIVVMDGDGNVDDDEDDDDDDLPFYCADFIKSSDFNYANLLGSGIQSYRMAGGFLVLVGCIPFLCHSGCQ